MATRDSLEEINQKVLRNRAKLTVEEINMFFLSAYITVGSIYDRDFYHRPAKQDQFLAFRRDWWKDDPRIDWLEVAAIAPSEELAPWGLPTWHPLSIPEYEKWIDQKEGVDRE